MIDKRKQIKTGELSLTKNQVVKLLDSIDVFEHKVFFELAVNLGLRRGDIVCLKWRDVDFDKQILSFFEHKKSRVRHVPLSPHIVQLLKMLKHQSSNSYYIFSGGSDRKYGFGHLSERSAYNYFQMYLVKAGIQKASDRRPFHCLRATCIKLCQQAGFTVEQAAKHIGDTVRVVQEHYATPSDEEMREVVCGKKLF